MHPFFMGFLSVNAVWGYKFFGQVHRVRVKIGKSFPLRWGFGAVSAD